MDILNDFILFLIEQECVKEYFKNLENYRETSTFFNTHKPKLWVEYAFGWDDSPEGFKHWNYKDELWKHRIRQNEKLRDTKEQ